YLFFFQAEDGIRDFHVTGVQTCALPIYKRITLSDNLTKEVIQVKDLFTNENGTIQIIQRKLINFLEQLGYGVFTKSSKFLKGTRSEERRVGKECRYRWSMKS